MTTVSATATYTDFKRFETSATIKQAATFAVGLIA